MRCSFLQLNGRQSIEPARLTNWHPGPPIGRPTLGKAFHAADRRPSDDGSSARVL